MPKSAAPRCAVLLSGGADSAAAMAALLRDGWDVRALWAEYGQPAAGAERRASGALARHYAVPWTPLDLPRLGPAAPDGEIAGRNDLLVAAARAAAPEASIAIGIHTGTPYADCSRDWALAWQALLDAQHGGAVRLLTPLVDLVKGEILALADGLGVPLSLTHSCERADTPCRACPSCLDREAGLARA